MILKKKNPKNEMKNYIKITLCIFLIFYLMIGVFLIAINKFSFNRIVLRDNSSSAECVDIGNNLSESAPNEMQTSCSENPDLSWGYHFSWITWKFFTKDRGYDTAKYAPLDLAAVSLVIIFIVIVKLKNNIKTSSRKA